MTVSQNKLLYGLSDSLTSLRNSAERAQGSNDNGLGDLWEDLQSRSRLALKEHGLQEAFSNLQNYGGSEENTALENELDTMLDEARAITKTSLANTEMSSIKAAAESSAESAKNSNENLAATVETESLSMTRKIVDAKLDIAASFAKGASKRAEQFNGM